jgi:acetyl-CoA decarbonylase/synthase complex subunit epsilon
MQAESWQTAEVPGPTKALVITKPEVVFAMVKKAKRPILVVGHEAIDIDVGKEKLIDYTIRLAKTGHIPVVATAHIVGEFIKRGFPPAAWMPAVDITNRLQDSGWKGLDGKGQYDVALFTGLPYYMQWILFSTLKHFALNLKTISLDRFYQPHATWSFPNMSLKDWNENLEVILSKLGEK